MLFSVPHKSSVPYQFLVRGRSGTACCSQDWGHRMRHIHGFPSGNILLTTKLLSHDPLSWDIDSLLTLWPLLIPCSLDNGCCTFGFLIFIHCQKKFLVQQPMYTHKRIIKTPLLHQTWVPVSFFLSRSLSLSLRLILWSVETCPGFQVLPKRAPCASVSGTSPVLGPYWFSA